MANATKCDVFYAIFSFIGILSGISGCVVFLFVFKNVDASVWAFISGKSDFLRSDPFSHLLVLGMYAATYFFLMCLKMRESIDEWYGTSHLFRLAIFGGIGSLASIIAFLAYLSLIITRHERKCNYRSNPTVHNAPFALMESLLYFDQ